MTPSEKAPVSNGAWELLRRSIVVFLGFLLLWLAVPQRGAAQEASRFSFVLRGVPLDDALRELITTTHLDLSYDPSIVSEKRVFCVTEDVPAEEVLRCLLRGTGLDFYRLSSGLYVLIEAAEAPPRLGHLQGIVVDASTGEPLPDAHVLLADGSLGAVANATGRFQFADLRPGTYHVTTSYLGYRSRVDSVHVPPAGTARTRLSLESEPVLVAPVVVDGMQWRRGSDGLGRASLLQEALLEGSIGGASELTQHLGTLVGVRLNDATAALHVQGGEAGEHQFRLDGAPVFVPVSLGGLVGPFSPFAIGRVTVHKTGFGADLGSQSAGVIEAEHALGVEARQRLEVQADPMSLNARLGVGLGPPRARRGAFLLAGRVGLWDVYTPSSVRHLLEDWNQADPFMLAAFSEVPPGGDETDVPVFQRAASSGDPALGFYDLHGAMRLRFGALQSLHVSGYLGRRTLDSERNVFETLAALQRAANTSSLTRDLYAWNNTTLQARYEAVLSARLLASLRGRASLYRLRHDFVTQQAAFADNTAGQVRLGPRDDNNNRIREYAVEGRLDAAVRDGWQVEAGVAPTYTHSRFLVQGTQQLPIVHLSSAWRVAGFLTNRWTLSRRLSADVGTRLTYLATQRKAFAEPRLAVRYDHPGGALGPWSFRLATGLYRQFVNQFDVSSRSARALSATSRMWLGVDASVTPPKAVHLASEWLWRPHAGWTLRLEGYYKRHLHLLAIDYAARTPSQNPEDEFADDLGGRTSLAQAAFLADGEGATYGAALLVEKRLQHARIEARYEYSRAERSFRTFYEGETLPVPWNEPHRVEVAFDWMPTSRLTVLARWKGIWGRAWGFRQSYYDFLGAYDNFSALLPDPLDVSILDHILAYELQRPQTHRLPPAYQLDLSGAYTLPLAGVTLQTRLDLLNVLDRDNVADWRFVLDPDYYAAHGLLRRDGRLLLPFTPSLAVRLAW